MYHQKYKTSEGRGKKINWNKFQSLAKTGCYLHRMSYVKFTATTHTQKTYSTHTKEHEKRIIKY